MGRQYKESRSAKSLELFARFLMENSSRYEREALTLLQEGQLQLHVDGVTVFHFIRDGGSGYQVASTATDILEEIFFQSLSDDRDFQLKLLIDQIAQSEVDASFLIDS